MTIYLIIFYTIWYILKNSDLRMKAKKHVWKFYTNKGNKLNNFKLNEVRCH